ncbi:hypothetical protein STEG23_002441, partial [Scotinomys teguina]
MQSSCIKGSQHFGDGRTMGGPPRTAAVEWSSRNPEDMLCVLQRTETEKSPKPFGGAQMI